MDLTNPLNDYKTWTVQVFLDECKRLNIEARSFVFLASKLKEKHYEERYSTNHSHSAGVDEEEDGEDVDLDEEMEGLQLSAEDGFINLRRERELQLAADMLDLNSYPEIPDFEAWDYGSLVRAYKNRNLGDLPGEVLVSKPALAKSLISFESCVVEKRFKAQVLRGEGSDTARIDFNDELMVKHFELEEKYLNLLVGLEKYIGKERVAKLERKFEGLSVRRERWLRRGEMGGEVDEDGPTFGVIERTSILA